MLVLIDYASPSALTSTREESALDLRSDGRRPVRLHARVKKPYVLSVRLALRALGEVVWSDDTWIDDGWYGFVLDPVVTVHDDRVFFEAFSQDQSVYALAIVDRAALEPEGQVRSGTTNVDFTAWLWGALGEMRSSRTTWLRIGPEGLEVSTEGGGGRFEPKVEIPDHWVRGFLQMQAAAAMPGTRLTVTPVDLLSAIRFLRYTKAKVSPRALRYEMPPGEDARLVIEPFEHVVPLRGAAHGREELHRIRTWGRRRLRLLEPLLPYASEVRVYLKGRALPSFYAAELPGVTFVLGLTGWTANTFTESGGHDLASGIEDADERIVNAAIDALSARQAASAQKIADAIGASLPDTDRALARLCRRGRAIYDVERRDYRHRELFGQPLDVKRESELFPPDARRAEGRKLLAGGAVRVESCTAEESIKVRTLKTPEGKVTRELVYRDHRVVGSMPGAARTEVVVAENGRVIFGTCGCAFFEENLLNRGPCAHMVALLEASAGLRTEGTSSRSLETGGEGVE